MKQLFVLLTLNIFFVVSSWAQTCHTGKLDPRVAATLKTVLPDLKPESANMSVEQIREEKIKASGSFPKTDVQYINVAADKIPIQIYNPAHTTNLPIIISYHPGGFVTPILPFMEYDFWQQAKNYGAIVFAVDYRIAPLNKFPAAVSDAYNAFTWVAAHGQEYGGDTSRIVVLGLSAGGNLAAVVCQKAKKEGVVNKIKLQVLNCPSTDNPHNSANYPSYQQFPSGYFLTKEFCQYYIQAYAPDAGNNPEVAPIRSNDVSGLPPAVVITAEFDPLRDEGAAYSDRLRKAGVQVWYKCFSGQIHCLLGLPDNADERKVYDKLIVNAMKEVLKR